MRCRTTCSCTPLFHFLEYPLLQLSRYSITADLGIFQFRPILSAGITPRFKRSYTEPLPMFRISLRSSMVSTSSYCSSILQRQREGIAIAKEQGVYKGRKPIDCPDFETVISQWRSGQISAVDAMQQLNMTKTTFYRKVKKVGA